MAHGVSCVTTKRLQGIVHRLNGAPHTATLEIKTLPAGYHIIEIDFLILYAKQTCVLIQISQ